MCFANDPISRKAVFDVFQHCPRIAVFDVPPPMMSVTHGGKQSSMCSPTCPNSKAVIGVFQNFTASDVFFCSANDPNQQSSRRCLPEHFPQRRLGRASTNDPWWKAVVDMLLQTTRACSSYLFQHCSSRAVFIVPPPTTHGGKQSSMHSRTFPGKPS